MNTSAEDRRIRGLRPARQQVDPYTAHGTLLETERRPDGRAEDTLTVFLAGAECPFACSFCDLWKWTIDGPTPPGALTRQLRKILDSLPRPFPQRLKLYNASNFFDPRAVPIEDADAIASLCDSFAAVTVESHANTIGAKTLAFANRIRGRLEVAMGLETIHPTASAAINKRLRLERFDRAGDFLRQNGIDLRVFALLGAPHIARAETIEWTVRTVRYAADRGASVVSIIPVRAGNGELERLAAAGEFAPPTLTELEKALDQCVGSSDTVVTADLWDIDRLSTCAECRTERVARLQRMNLSQQREPGIVCAKCGVS